LVEFATAVTEHLKKTMPITHPIEEEKDLGFLHGTMLTDGLDEYDANIGTQNIFVFADRQVGVSCKQL